MARSITQFLGNPQKELSRAEPGCFKTWSCQEAGLWLGVERSARRDELSLHRELSAVVSS